MKDRLSTRDILRRRHMPLPSYTCVMCSLNHEVTLEHLFLLCPLANTGWLALNVTCPTSWSKIFELFESFKQQLKVPFSMEVVILFCWRHSTLSNGGKTNFQARIRYGYPPGETTLFPHIVTWIDSVVIFDVFLIFFLTSFVS